MSGGSWNYAYKKVEEMAEGLENSEYPIRRQFAKHLKLVAEAMHDIEWVDSYDMSHPDEVTAIEKVIGKEAK